ncbi:MAG: patatin-like phospholipase family protein [Cypionkella sp.]
MKKLLTCLIFLVGCAAWNKPINAPLAGENPALVEVTPETIGSGEVYVGLAFSGGGMRASAFAYGMLQELQAQGAITGTNDGLLDTVRLVSGVSGGSVTAAQFGLYGPRGLDGYREKYLITNAEKYMANSLFNPLTVVNGLAGGANGRNTFGRYLDETLFHHATFGDLRARSKIKTWINATDMANNTPFLFSPETFDALCSDLSKLSDFRGGDSLGGVSSRVHADCPCGPSHRLQLSRTRLVDCGAQQSRGHRRHEGPRCGAGKLFRSRAGEIRQIAGWRHHRQFRHHGFGGGARPRAGTLCAHVARRGGADEADAVSGRQCRGRGRLWLDPENPRPKRAWLGYVDRHGVDVGGNKVRL